MNKFVFAFVAFAAIAAGGVMAKPSYHGVAPAPSIAYNAAPAPSVSYHAIPAPQPAPVYRAPAAAPSYSAPTYSSVHLQPVAVQNSYGAHAAPAPPSLLIAEHSNPIASSAASTSIAGLPAGHYRQLVVPSYELLAGHKLNIVGGYGAQAAQAAY